MLAARYLGATCRSLLMVLQLWERFPLGLVAMTTEGETPSRASFNVLETDGCTDTLLGRPVQGTLSSLSREKCNAQRPEADVY